MVRVIGKGTYVASGGRQPAECGEFNPGRSTEEKHLAFLIGENIFQFVQPGYSRILVGAEQTCRQPGYRLLFHSVGEEENDPQLGLSPGSAERDPRLSRRGGTSQEIARVGSLIGTCR